MQDIDTFLAALAAKRRAEQARNRPALTLSPGFPLPRELEIAAKHGWFLQPVLAHSIYASEDARVGVPDNTRAQIESWAAAYPDCNWELTTGRDSGVIALKADMRVAFESLRQLCCNDWSTLERTLRFEAGAHGRVALFQYGENILRSRLPGFRVMSNGETILVPPSRLSRDIEFFYSDPFAVLAEPPQWLLAPKISDECFAESA